MKKGFLFSWLLAVVMLMMLAACGTDTKDSGSGTNDPAPTTSTDGQQTPPPATTPPPAPAKPKDPVAINIVTPDATTTPEFIEALNARFPDYTIVHYNQDAKTTTIPELIAGGTPIDIIGRAAGGFGNEVISHDLQFDMSDMIKKYNIKLEDFEPQLVNYVRSISNGGMYGIPGGSAINHVLFYNKTLFDKFGIDYPVDGMTWTEAMDLAVRMTRVDDDKQIYGFTGHTGIMLNWNQLGLSVADPVTNKPTIGTDDRWKSYFQIIFGNPTLNEAYKSNGRAFSGGTARLVGGDSAMVLFNASIAIVNASLQNEEIDWDMVALPTFAEAPRTGSPMNSTIWGLTSVTRDRDAAMDVISYLVSDENLGSFAKKGYLVPNVSEKVTSVFATEATPANKNWGAITYNQFAPFSVKAPYDTNVRLVYEKVLEQIVKGELDMNTAFRMAEEEGQQIINEYLSAQ